MSTVRSSSPGCGSPRSAVIGMVRPPTASRSSSTSGKCSRSSTKMRARKPWVWWTCGAPRRSAANASSASAPGRAAGRARRSVTSWPARPRASASDSPPTPPPTITTRRLRLALWQRALPATVGMVTGVANHRRPRPGWAGIPAEDRRADRRVRLLDAAFELLGTEGWSATTVRAVCQAAQLNPRYFYESFDGPRRACSSPSTTARSRSWRRSSSARPTRPAPEPGQPGAGGPRAHRRLRRDDPRRGRVLYVEALGNEALNRRRIEAGHAARRPARARRRGALRPPARGRAHRPHRRRVPRRRVRRAAAGLARRPHRRPEAQLVDDASALFLAIGEAADRIATSRAYPPVPGLASGRGPWPTCSLARAVPVRQRRTLACTTSSSGRAGDPGRSRVRDGSIRRR